MYHHRTGLFFDIPIDFRTFVTVLGINLGFRDLSTLEVVQIPNFSAEMAQTTYKGKNYYLQQYFDPAYPGMAAMVCLSNYYTGDQYFCMMRLDAVFLLPFSNALGGELSWDYAVAQYCNWYVRLRHGFISIIFVT